MSNSTKFSMVRDINGYNGFGILPTYDIWPTSLTANEAQSVITPSSFHHWMAIFTYAPGASIWVSFTGTAAVPGTTFALGISVLNPAGRQVYSGQTISFITADETMPWVCVEFQAIAPYTNG